MSSIRFTVPSSGKGLSMRCVQHIVPVIALVLVSGCGGLRGPLAGFSAAFGTPAGDLMINETRHRPSLIDYYMQCRQKREQRACTDEMRDAIRFSCSETMDARVYAICLRCVAQQAPDDSECAGLAATLVASGGGSMNGYFAVPGQPFKGDGTADPRDHPPVAPLPPMNETSGAWSLPMRSKRLPAGQEP